jgi:ribonuclease D
MLNSEEIIVTAASLAALTDCLLRESVIAVDTEADSLYSYFDKVCLLQFSTREADYLVDPLALKDLSVLAPLFSSNDVEKVFHACEYDILCLKRDHHFIFNNIFDTMIAARILGWKNVGLGNILQERFDVELNKKLQRADWGHRPLKQEELTYAREDTHYLLALRDSQLAELRRLERLEEAREEFWRLTQVEPTPRRFDPDGYWHVKGARELDPPALGMLRELYRLRETQARKENRPPFKVLSEATLVALSSSAPSSPKELARQVSDFAQKRYGPSILEAISRGQAQPQSSPPRPNSRHGAPLDNAARARLERLKEWRKKRAAARGVENDVIVPNDVLTTLARRQPQTVEEIARMTGLGRWKLKEYGGELLGVLGKK